MSDYLKFGFLASLSFGYRLPLMSMTLGLDLLGGVRDSGISALLAVRSISQPVLIKFVSYALGGLEVSYQVFRSI